MATPCLHNAGWLVISTGKILRPDTGKKKTATQTAIKSGIVTYPICDDSLSRSARPSPASLQKCVKKALLDMVLVQVQRLSGIAST